MPVTIKNSCHNIYNGNTGRGRTKGEIFQQFINEEENKNGKISVTLPKIAVQKGGTTRNARVPQKQKKTGSESKMQPKPVFDYLPVRAGMKISIVT